MEALHSGEGNSHPHRPPTSTVHADIREVTELSPLEMVHCLRKFHLNIKYKKGNTNNVVYFLNRPSVMALITVLDSCGHETSGWSHIYKSDLEFDII